MVLPEGGAKGHHPQQILLLVIPVLLPLLLQLVLMLNCWLLVALRLLLLDRLEVPS
jgi:hypothetical protein